MESTVFPSCSAVRSMWRSGSADAALSEKSPYLGGAQVRWIFGRNPSCSRMSFRGRDRSPSGPPLWRIGSAAFRVCGSPCLWTRRFRRNRPTSEVLGLVEFLVVELSASTVISWGDPERHFGTGLEANQVLFSPCLRQKTADPRPVQRALRVDGPPTCMLP